MAVTVDAARRRLVFGVNALVQAVLALLVVVGLVYLAGRLAWQADVTGARINTLSPRTKKLLAGLEQNIRLTAIFAEPDKRDEYNQKRHRQIKDLLELYDRSGGARLTTALLDPSLDKAGTDKLLARLRELPAYKTEAEPHQQALTKFPAISERIRAAVAGEAARLEEFSRADARLAKDRNFAIVFNNMRVIPKQGEKVAEEMRELTQEQAGGIPRYGRAVRALRDYLTAVEAGLRDSAAWMTGNGTTLAGGHTELAAYFAEAPQRFEPLLKEITDLLAATQDLQDVKLEKVYGELMNWATSPPVLVESEREARVVGSWEIWNRPATLDAGPEQETFNGESALSSAILQLTAKEKTAVIFTYYGGPSPIRPDFSNINLQMLRELPRAPYGELNAALQKSNFVTAEWDVSREKKPPEVADAARRIYVVFPPTPPPQPNQFQPAPQPGMTPEDRQLVLDAVEAGGLAVFLTGWMGGNAPFPGAPATYEYGEYLKTTWGIEGLYGFVTLEFAGHPDKGSGWYAPATREPWLISTNRSVQLTDHPIAKPARMEPTAFFQVAPLRFLPPDRRPAGVTLEVLAEISGRDDVWATDDLRRLDEQWRRERGLQPAAGDVRPPFPIAVAASNEAGKKVVVFASERFVADALAAATGFQLIGNALVAGLLYPGNTDVFVNALHWLTGEADRIALGPRQGELPRLSKLTPGWAAALPWFLVGVWPAVALVVGVGVWAVRRR